MEYFFGGGLKQQQVDVPPINSNHCCLISMFDDVCFKVFARTSLDCRLVGSPMWFRLKIGDNYLNLYVV